MNSKEAVETPVQTLYKFYRNSHQTQKVKFIHPELPKPKVVFYNYCCFNVLKVATFSFHGDLTLFNTQPLQLLRYWIRPFCVRPIF